jgi:MFS family permease
MSFEKAKKHPLAAFPDFRRLFCGRLISAVGDKFFTIALAWWIISQGGPKSKLHLGLLLAVNSIPVVIAGPFMGTLVDRMDRRRCMLTADAARFLLMIALCLLLYSGSLALGELYAICFLLAAFIPLFESSVGGSLADLTDEASLSSAVATDASVIQLSAIIGAAIGSVLLASAGVLGAFTVNALAFMCSFAAVYSIKTPLMPHSASARPDYTGELKAGIAYITGEKPLLSLLCCFAAINFFAAPLILLMPMLVKFRLNAPAAWLAIFELFFALGAGLTGMAMSFKASYKNIYVWIFGSVFALGILLSALAFADGKFALCALIFASGAVISAGNSVALMLFQHTVPAELKGRFFAALTTISFAVMPITFAITGMLADMMPLSRLILIDSAGCVITSFALLMIPRIREEF